jgi:hypothetical protein
VDPTSSHAFFRASTVGNSTDKGWVPFGTANFLSVVIFSLDLDEESLGDSLSSPVVNTLAYFLLRRQVEIEQPAKKTLRQQPILYQNVSAILIAIFRKRTARKGAWVSQPWDLILPCKIITLG